MRLSEALALRKEDINLDSLLINVKQGKGRKERIVQITLKGRKTLYNWLKSIPGPYVFATHLGTPIALRSAQHDLTEFCERAGITGVRMSPHTLRHTFAVSYLRSGGNLEYLRRILGHSSLAITQKYLESIQPEDLQSGHTSPLNPKKRRDR